MGSFSYQGYDTAALDIQYNARASVASFEDEYARQVAVSQGVLKDFNRQTGIIYDQKSGQSLDFYPVEKDAPLFVWIHGGYWRGGKAPDNAFAVPGLHKHGFAVAVLNYSLAPAVTLDEIVRQIRSAISFLHENRSRLGIGDRPFVVGGSSAGGHLSAMLSSDDWFSSSSVPDDIIGVVLDLSGLHDLTPLMHTHVNAWMNFDEDMIARNSPQFLLPVKSDVTLIASVGGLETSEFRRQTNAYASAWSRASYKAVVVDMSDYNHFNLPLTLIEPDGKLVRAVVEAYARYRKGNAQ